MKITEKQFSEMLASYKIIHNTDQWAEWSMSKHPMEEIMFALILNERMREDESYPICSLQYLLRENKFTDEDVKDAIFITSGHFSFDHWNDDVVDFVFELNLEDVRDYADIFEQNTKSENKHIASFCKAEIKKIRNKQTESIAYLIKCSTMHERGILNQGKKAEGYRIEMEKAKAQMEKAKSEISKEMYRCEMLKMRNLYSQAQRSKNNHISAVERYKARIKQMEENPEEVSIKLFFRFTDMMVSDLTGISSDMRSALKRGCKKVWRTE